MNLTRLAQIAASGLTFLLSGTQLITGASAAIKKDNVDFQYFEMDAEVEDMLWCGQENEAVLVKTKEGTVYRSRDRGATWSRLHGQMHKHAGAVADQGQEVGHVSTMTQSPVDDSLVVFIGTTGINWVTEDCGANLRALNSGKVIEEFRFHPHERNRALAASWTNCDKIDGEDEPCRIFKELYTTENLGIEWKYLTNYVFDFEWAVSRKTKENTHVHVPEERVFCTRESNNTDHQSHAGVRGNWSPHVDLYMSDDLFATTPKLLLESANTIVKTDAYMFVTRHHKDSEGGMVNVFVSNYKSGFARLVEAQLPDGEVNMGHSFTILDTQEDQVFLFLENHGHSSPFGSLYISDESGHYYTLSMKNVIKGTSIDFERVNSLDGTYVANVYSPNGKRGGAIIKSAKHASKEEIGTDSDQEDHTPEVDHLDFSESEITAHIAEEEGESHMQDTGDMNAKQASTNIQVHRIAESVAASEVESNVRTMITHNKGASWDVIKAPLKTSKGKSIQCAQEEGCSLHLEIYSSAGAHSPVYSSDSAVGIVIGTGNLGEYLSGNNIQKNLYVSRDGGITFTSTHVGNYIYDIGDHGALIVASKVSEATDSLEFTWDYGKTWETVKIANHPIHVKNIITEPRSTSQQFLVYGVNELKGDEEEESEEKAKAALVYVDFAKLHEPQCKGADAPGTEKSDYESWTPYDGRHGDNKCYLGQQVTYVRRKPDVKCFNGENFDRIVHRSACTCTEYDYECDIGYFRKPGSMTCTKGESTLSEAVQASLVTTMEQHQCAEGDYFTKSSGYRKIPGDMCFGGTQLAPQYFHCQAGILGMHWSTIVIGVVLIGACYYGWAFIEAILILLPIPDPKGGIDAAKGYFHQFVRCFKDLFQGVSEKPGEAPQEISEQGYSNFEQAPQSVLDDDVNSDDDVGREMTNVPMEQKMDYDSPTEDNENGVMAQDEDLLQINSEPGSGSGAKSVPKLRKPKKQSD